MAGARALDPLLGPLLRRLPLLARKAVRDLWQLRGPSVALGAVVAAGVASFVAMRSMVPHLAEAQRAYYGATRFADAWVLVRRAPRSELAALRAIPGVAAAEGRVAGALVLEVPGLEEPASARLVGVPAGGMRLSRVVLRQGRWLAPGADDEVLVGEGFAEANALRPGMTVGALLQGRWRRLRIAGVVLSPEHVLEMRPGELFPDARRFGVLWMAEAPAAAAFGLAGAWNEAALALAPGVDVRAVLRAVDARVARYGGSGALGRGEHPSHRYLSDEIGQARTFAAVLPSIFLGVAAFLVHLVLGRLVGTQREQVGMLKAFGMGPGALARHYAWLALVPVLGGAVVGGAAGVWLAGKLALVYAESYRIPDAPFRWHGGVLAVALLGSAAVALTGALGSVRRVWRLPPAEAMRPEPPVRYRAGWLERRRLDRWLSPVGRMTVRSITRRPARAALAVIGMALAVAVVIVGGFSFDAIGAMRTVQFEQAQREALAVTFTAPRGPEALRALARLPGVWQVEPQLTVPVRLVAGGRQRSVGLVAVAPGAALRRVVDTRGRPVALPLDGLLLSRALATLLDVAPGDAVRVEVQRGDRPVVTMRVGALLDDLVGTTAYLPLATVERTLRQGAARDGAALAVDPAQLPLLYRTLTRTAAVAAVSAREAYLRAFDRLVARSFRVTLVTLFGFAMVLAVGVVYDTTRIALAERGRELASLRVLGFTQGEVARLLFGEQALLGVVAVPVGCLLGVGLCLLMIGALESELFRLPLALRVRTVGGAVGVLAASGVVSAWLVRRRLDRLEPVEALKTRE
ncbi:MAG: FtsX-like permease family protein [Gemmatimonadetes bacterium]|nr:FtsX-like permease family protein [Gemmatimonadota bacterium]